MQLSTLLTALVASAPLIAAHGKISQASGDQGGNGTALGIQGGVIPGAGRNKVTEPDTTVFKGANADGCGRTTGAGNNEMEAGTKQAMALSGDKLPQVSAGGKVMATVHIVTSDGAGPYNAEVNMDGTGTTWVPAEVTKQVPGTRGNIQKSSNRRFIRALENIGIVKRATNINEDYPIEVQLPANMQCTGKVANQENVCMVKIINVSRAGPFGGCVPVQQVSGGAAPATPPAAGPAARRRSFQS